VARISDSIIWTTGFPVAGQGGPGGTDGTAWFSNFTVDVEFGPEGLDAPSTFNSAIASFLAYEGDPVVYSGLTSYTPLGSATPVVLPLPPVGYFPVSDMPPVTAFTIAYGATIVPDQGATGAFVMGSISFLIQVF
jgi:hypothetical protein